MAVSRGIGGWYQQLLQEGWETRLWGTLVAHRQRQCGYNLNHHGAKQRQPVALKHWAFCSFLKKEQPSNHNHLYLDVFTDSATFFLFWQKYKGSNRKKSINYFPIQLLWKHWLARSCTVFHIGVFLMFMEKGSGYPWLFRNLSLCKGSLSPLK